VSANTAVARHSTLHATGTQCHARILQGQGVALDSQLDIAVS